MTTHIKVLLAIFVLLSIIVVYAFLAQCIDGLFIGGCGLGRLIILSLAIIAFTVFVIISSLIYRSFVKKLKILKWRDYVAIYVTGLLFTIVIVVVSAPLIFLFAIFLGDIIYP